MTVTCISTPIRDDLIWFITDRIKTLSNVKKLHRGLLSEDLSVKECPECKISFTDEKCPICGKIGIQKYTGTGKKTIKKKSMSKEGYEFFHDLCENAILNYTTLAVEFTKCPICGEQSTLSEGTINCVPIEIKQDIIPYLNNRSKRYEENGQKELSQEAKTLANLFKNRVSNCTNDGRPSYSWLKNRGYKKSDLVEAGNILQISDKIGYGKKTYKGIEL